MTNELSTHVARLLPGAICHHIVESAYTTTTAATFDTDYITPFIQPPPSTCTRRNLRTLALQSRREVELRWFSAPQRRNSPHSLVSRHFHPVPFHSQWRRVIFFSWTHSKAVFHYGVLANENWFTYAKMDFFWQNVHSKRCLFVLFTWMQLRSYKFVWRNYWIVSTESVKTITVHSRAVHLSFHLHTGITTYIETVTRMSFNVLWTSKK